MKQGFDVPLWKKALGMKLTGKKKLSVSLLQKEQFLS